MAYGKHEPSTVPEERGCEVIIDYIVNELANDREPLWFSIDDTDYQLYIDVAAPQGATARVLTTLGKNDELVGQHVTYRITVSRVMD